MITKQFNLEARDSDVFQIVELEGADIARITYSKSVDDVMIVVEGADILMSWDMDDWNDEKCIPVREKDNLKEIGKISCTHLLFKSKDGAKVKIYTVAQLN